MENERSILSYEYVSEILVFLLEKKTVKCADLSEVVTSPTTRRNVLKKMKEKSLVEIQTNLRPRKTYIITLTQYGTGVARKVREAYDMMEGREPEVEDQPNHGSSADVRGEMKHASG